MAAVDVAPSVAMGMSQVRTQAIRLFAVGFLVLFMELACIRWFATYVIFLQFFTNVVLIASFLGMSCGCLAAGRRHHVGMDLIRSGTESDLSRHRESWALEPRAAPRR